MSALKSMWLLMKGLSRRAGRDFHGSRNPVTSESKLFNWAHDRFLQLRELTQRTAPTLIVIVLNIFR